MKKISALAAVLLIGTVIGVREAQTTGTPNSEPVFKGCRGTSRVQPQSRNKTRAVNHQKKRPSSNSCGRHFGGFLFLSRDSALGGCLLAN
jgi:hypothetical protein